MKINTKRAAVIAWRYAELQELADRFAEQHDDGNRRSPFNVQIDRDGNVTYEKNTACHCHPEYETFSIPSTEFGKWLDKQ